MTRKIVKKKRKINACRKGKSGERLLANWLKDRGVLSARRTQQHNGADGKSDVIAPTELAHWHIESKRVASGKVNLCILNQWAMQLERDCEEGQHPALFMRANNGLMIVFFLFNTIKDLFLNNPAFLVSTGKSFDPQKIIHDGKLSQRVHARVYGITKKPGDILAVFEVKPGLELYAMEGDDALAQMLMKESTYAKQTTQIPETTTPVEIDTTSYGEQKI